MKQTMEISPGTESSAGASDDTNPKAFILVKEFPDLLNLSTGSFVDGIEFVSSGQSDLDHSFVWKRDTKMFVAQGSEP